MKKILITGGSGFIGRNLKEKLADEYEISAPGHDELDLCSDMEVCSLLKSKHFDVVIHTATHNATTTSQKDLNLVLDMNLRMFFNLARCNCYYEKMIYYGSGAEYDMRNYIPMMCEEYFDWSVPVDSYGFSKYIMSKIAGYLPNVYDLRMFGVFGKYEDWEIRFISNTCCKAIFDLPITIKQNVYFDYLYIDDLVEITKWFIENQPEYKHYNVTTGRKVDLLTIARKVLEISKKDLPILIAKEGLKKEYTGSNKRFLEEIGNFKFTDLDESIKKLYDWYRENINIKDKNLLLFDR